MVTAEVSCSWRKAVLLWQQSDQELSLTSVLCLCSEFQLPTCFAWPGCAPPAPSSHLGWLDWAVERSWGVSAAPLARGDLYGHHLPAWGEFNQILEGFGGVRGKVCVDLSPHLNAAQCHSVPRLRRSFPRSLAWLHSLRHTSTTRNICPSFMQSVSITNNYLSSSLFLLCWLLSWCSVALLEPRYQVLLRARALCHGHTELCCFCWPDLARA